MQDFIKRLPLSGKLLIIAIIPFLFIGFLSLQVFQQKTTNIKQVGSFIKDIHQSATISRLIDHLQKEGRLGFDYVLTGQGLEEMHRERHITDSLLKRLDAIHNASLNHFRDYTFLTRLDTVRGQVDQKAIQTNGVVDYYSTTIFRLNTINHVPGFNYAYLEEASQRMDFQRLLSELITYQSIISTNVYNVLFTRKYMIETLLGTFGSYRVYTTYEKEITARSNPSSLKQFQDIRNHSAYDSVDAYFDKLFTSFRFDSTMNYSTWNQLSVRSLNELRGLQQEVLKDVETSLNKFYEREKEAKTRTVLYLLIIATIVITIVSYILATINHSLNELKKAAVKIADGSTDIHIRKQSNDAIGSLALSINRINEKNKELAWAAREIGNGKFDTAVNPRGPDDILGNSLLQMKNDLQQFTNDLETSREDFKKLADLVPQIVWTADADGKMNYYNEKWFEITGAKPGFDEQTWIPILHPADVGPSLLAWHHSVETGHPYQIEYRIRDARNGKYRWFLGRALPVRDDSGKVVKWFGTGTDIHDQKLQHEKLEEMVAQRTLELERSNEDLQQFAHVASHDLKEPVRKLITFSSRLEDEFGSVIPDRGKTFLNKLKTAAERMAKMIDSILSYSVVNSREEKKEAVDLNLVMEDIINDLELLIMQKQARVLYAGLPKLRAFPLLMHQLLYNLISNALKFTKEGTIPVIDISASRVNASDIPLFPELQKAPEYYRITIEDNGIGFNQEFAEKMFNVFTRLNSKDKFEGTGLGLALCRKIVHRHGGVIYARGKEGEGAIFEIILPAA